MSGIKALIKQNPIVKQYRVKKWIKYSRRMMFSSDETKSLEKDPQKIREAVRRHIKNTPDIPDDIEKDLDLTLSKSYLADTGRVTNDLKTDMLFWYFAYGFSFNEYLCYRFIDKTREERMKFFSDRESVSLGYELNDIDDMMVFSDKMNTYNKYASYYGREAVSVESASDFDKFRAFAEKHRVFVKKEVDKACGKSVELIDLDACGKSLKELFEYLLSEGKVILEEKVCQGAETAVFNDSSVNTIRCITLNSRKGMLVPYCFMKIGRSGAFVDNGGAGGILAGIDVETGVIGTDGVDENGIRYEIHPDSKVRFKGHQLPEWDKMITMCRTISAQTPSVRLIGWDMAYTDHGWTVIEGNAMTEVIGPQSTWLRGIRSDVEEFYKII